MKTILKSAAIIHRHGCNIYVSNSEQGLWCQLSKFCEEHREDAMDQEAFDSATTPEGKVRAYFDNHDTETLYLTDADYFR